MENNYAPATFNNKNGLLTGAVIYGSFALQKVVVLRVACFYGNNSNNREPQYCINKIRAIRQATLVNTSPPPSDAPPVIFRKKE